MATKKKPAFESLAMQHGAKAHGAQFIRKGFAATPALDLAYACGRGGHIFAPLDVLADLPAAEIAGKLTWPDATAHRNIAIHVLRCKNAPWFADPDPIEAEADPIDAAEAVKIIKKQWRGGAVNGIAFRALEAFVGGSAILPAILDETDKIKGEKGAINWDTGTVQSQVAFLHGLLLRVTEAEYKTARARLEKVVAKFAGMHGIRYLEIALGGSSTIPSLGYKYSTHHKCYMTEAAPDAPPSHHDLAFLDGEGDYIAEQDGRLWEAFGWKSRAGMISPPSARLAYMGGPTLLAHELRAIDGMSKKGHGELFDACFELRGPSVTAIMKKLAKNGVKKATAWLEA